MDPKKAIQTNIFFFTIVLALHALRSVLQWPVAVANVAIPVWISYVIVGLLIILLGINYSALKNL